MSEDVMLSKCSEAFGGEWAIIREFPNYAISQCGRVAAVRLSSRHISARPLAKPRLKSFNLGTRGYLRVYLYKMNEPYLRPIAHLVLETFVGPRPPGMECDHINRIVDDNRLVNLRWVTRTENLAKRNIARGSKQGASRLTETQVAVIRKLLNSGVSGQDLACICGVSAKSISQIKIGTSWKHVWLKC